MKASGELPITCPVDLWFAMSAKGTRTDICDARWSGRFQLQSPTSVQLWLHKVHVRFGARGPDTGFTLDNSHRIENVSKGLGRLNFPSTRNHTAVTPLELTSQCLHLTGASQNESAVSTSTSQKCRTKVAKMAAWAVSCLTNLPCLPCEQARLKNVWMPVDQGILHAFKAASHF